MFEMPERRFVLRYQPLEKAEQIAFYVRIGVLVYRQAASRVLREKSQNALSSPSFRGRTLSASAVISIISSR